MAHSSLGCLVSLKTLLLAFSFSYSLSHLENENMIKSATYLSPNFELGPGSVQNKFYYNIKFPRGHIAIKNFNGEVVDEYGNPIPLHETYLHHWAVEKYYQHKNSSISGQPDRIPARNSGICQGHVIALYFGIGSEGRKTHTYVPHPYGIEIGNLAQIPPGYEERWMLNVHAIDTRGVEDRVGCTECRCDLYNVTVDEFGHPLRPNYKGGKLCCYDQTQCKVREGFETAKRSLYLRYTVEWVDMDSSIIPVRIYVLDVTDDGERSNASTGIDFVNGCKIEYDVESCKGDGMAVDDCIDAKRTSLALPTGGYLIYGVAHQHAGGLGSTIYGQDGRVICTSIPIYGDGEEAGNEAGYVVEMSSCYPKPGSVQIGDGEKLILESNYTKDQMRTGVMGLFHLLVADQVPNPAYIQEGRKASTYARGAAALGFLE